MLDKIIKKILSIKRIGFFLAIRISIDIFYLGILAKIFNFHPWHASAPTSARPYRYLVAKIVNELKPKTVVEVGCGLGEILIRINAPQIYGYDTDEGAIRAARFLHGKKAIFIHGDLKAVSLQQINVLILINWIHEISPTVLEEQVLPLLPRTRYLLLDALDPEVPGYKHDFEFLKSKTELISINRPQKENRSFHLFKVLD